MYVNPSPSSSSADSAAKSASVNSPITCDEFIEALKTEQSQLEEQLKSYTRKGDVAYVLSALLLFGISTACVIALIHVIQDLQHLHHKMAASGTHHKLISTRHGAPHLVNVPNYNPEFLEAGLYYGATAAVIGSIIAAGSGVLCLCPAICRRKNTVQEIIKREEAIQFCRDPKNQDEIPLSTTVEETWEKVNEIIQQRKADQSGAGSASYIGVDGRTYHSV